MENTCVFFFFQTGGEGCAFGVAFGGMEGWEEGGRGGAFSICFSRFSNVILKGGCPPFFQGTFLHVFFCVSQECPHASNLPSFCDFRANLCECLCTSCCLFFVFWRPRHFAWTLLTQFGAFFLGLEAQGQNVMKPFRMHFCSFFRFCDFAETVLPCRRQYLFASLGGARPSLFHTGRL